MAGKIAVVSDISMWALDDIGRIYNGMWNAAQNKWIWTFQNGSGVSIAYGGGNIWVIGLDYNVYHFTGAGWQVHRINPAQNPVTDFINSLWVANDGDVWAANTSGVIYTKTYNLPTHNYPGAWHIKGNLPIQPPPPPPPPPPPGVWNYQVKQGDTLIGIVKWAYKITDWNLIWTIISYILTLNPQITDPDLIKAGSTIKMPPPKLPHVP